MDITRPSSEYSRLAKSEIVTWDQVRDLVKLANPILAKIIDEFKPSANHTLILASYPFGSNIFDKGELYIPDQNGQLSALKGNLVPAEIREKLNYSFSPIAMVLQKSIEVYVETLERRTVPFKLFRPGATIGVWDIMSHPLISLRQAWSWSVTAGARTLFMLPKIMDTANHVKLQRAYQLHTHVPRTIFEQGKIFEQIYKYKASENPWHTQMLFFSNKWLEPHPENLGWVKLKEYWAQEAWSQMLYWSNKMILDFNWELYTAELTRRKIKLKPYLLDTVKHLISIGCGVIPGFRPADESEQVAPTHLIQKAYVNDYRLKIYAPIIMHPDFLTTSGPIKSVYYSLQSPTLPEQPFEFETFSSVFKIIRELKDYMDIFLEIIKKLPKMNNETIRDLIECVKFDYFHTEIDEYNIIKYSSDMVKLDPSLAHCSKEFGVRQFPENAPFFKGCVRISLNNSSHNDQ